MSELEWSRFWRWIFNWALRAVWLMSHFKCSGDGGGSLVIQCFPVVFTASSTEPNQKGFGAPSALRNIPSVLNDNLGMLRECCSFQFKFC